jgi:hypothetical protein
MLTHYKRYTQSFAPTSDYDRYAITHECIRTSIEAFTHKHMRTYTHIELDAHNPTRIRTCNKIYTYNQARKHVLTHCNKYKQTPAPAQQVLRNLKCIRTRNETHTHKQTRKHRLTNCKIYKETHAPRQQLLRNHIRIMTRTIKQFTQSNTC